MDEVELLNRVLGYLEDISQSHMSPDVELLTIKEQLRDRFDAVARSLVSRFPLRTDVDMIDRILNHLEGHVQSPEFNGDWDFMEVTEVLNNRYDRMSNQWHQVEEDIGDDSGVEDDIICLACGGDVDLDYVLQAKDDWDESGNVPEDYEALCEACS